MITFAYKIHRHFYENISNFSREKFKLKSFEKSKSKIPILLISSLRAYNKDSEMRISDEEIKPPYDESMKPFPGKGMEPFCGEEIESFFDKLIEPF